MGACGIYRPRGMREVPVEKLRIGAVTIAQSPRTDITADAVRYLGDQVEILEFGALDRYSVEEAMRLKPVPGDYILTSRLRSGAEVHFSRSMVAEELQRGICLLETQGVQLILVLCTGELGEFQSSVPLLEPNLLLRAMVPLLTRKPRVLTLAPSEAQVRQSETRWKVHLPAFSFTSFAASPYGGMPVSEEAIRQINAMDDADLLIMDCLGFSCQMREQLKSRVNKHVILPRAMLYQAAAELLGIQPPL